MKFMYDGEEKYNTKEAGQAVLVWLALTVFVCALVLVSEYLKS